ncbi:MAG: hypothetical protein GY929_12525 [Actinomycetia bacterium]|nr:hypothetical protein [Actinomycetes bacterium]
MTIDEAMTELTHTLMPFTKELGLQLVSGGRGGRDSHGENHPDPDGAGLTLYRLRGAGIRIPAT